MSSRGAPPSTPYRPASPSLQHKSPARNLAQDDSGRTVIHKEAQCGRPGTADGARAFVANAQTLFAESLTGHRDRLSRFNGYLEPDEEFVIVEKIDTVQMVPLPLVANTVQTSAKDHRDIVLRGTSDWLYQAQHTLEPSRTFFPRTNGQHGENETTTGLLVSYRTLFNTREVAYMQDVPAECIVLVGPSVSLNNAVADDAALNSHGLRHMHEGWGLQTESGHRLFVSLQQQKHVIQKRFNKLLRGMSVAEPVIHPPARVCSEPVRDCEDLYVRLVFTPAAQRFQMNALQKGAERLFTPHADDASMFHTHAEHDAWRSLCADVGKVFVGSETKTVAEKFRVSKGVSDGSFAILDRRRLVTQCALSRDGCFADIRGYDKYHAASHAAFMSAEALIGFDEKSSLSHVNINVEFTGPQLGCGLPLDRVAREDGTQAVTYTVVASVFPPPSQLNCVAYVFSVTGIDTENVAAIAETVRCAGRLQLFADVPMGNEIASARELCGYRMLQDILDELKPCSIGGHNFQNFGGPLTLFRYNHLAKVNIDRHGRTARHATVRPEFQTGHSCQTAQIRRTFHFGKLNDVEESALLLGPLHHGVHIADIPGTHVFDTCTLFRARKEMPSLSLDDLMSEVNPAFPGKAGALCTDIARLCSSPASAHTVAANNLDDALMSTELLRHTQLGSCLAVAQSAFTPLTLVLHSCSTAELARYVMFEREWARSPWSTWTGTARTHTKPSFKGARVLSNAGRWCTNTAEYDAILMYSSLIVAFNVGGDTTFFAEDAPARAKFFTQSKFGTSIPLPPCPPSPGVPQVTCIDTTEPIVIMGSHESVCASKLQALYQLELVNRHTPDVRKAIKRMLNGMYGMLSYVKSPLFARAAAPAITSIVRSWSFTAEQCVMNMQGPARVVGGDTDSIKVEFCVPRPAGISHVEQARMLFTAANEFCVVLKKRCTEQCEFFCNIDMSMRKFSPLYVFPRKKVGIEIAITAQDADLEIFHTGNAIKKRNSTKLIKQFMQRLAAILTTDSPLYSRKRACVQECVRTILQLLDGWFPYSHRVWCERSAAGAGFNLGSEHAASKSVAKPKTRSGDPQPLLGQYVQYYHIDTGEPQHKVEWSGAPRTAHATHETNAMLHTGALRLNDMKDVEQVLKNGSEVVDDCAACMPYLIDMTSAILLPAEICNGAHFFIASWDPDMPSKSEQEHGPLVHVDADVVFDPVPGFTVVMTAAILIHSGFKWVMNGPSFFPTGCQIVTLPLILESTRVLHPNYLVVACEVYATPAHPWFTERAQLPETMAVPYGMKDINVHSPKNRCRFFLNKDRVLPVVR